MGILGKIFGVGGGTDAVGAVGNVLDNLFTSTEEKLDKQAVLERLRQQPSMAQTEINKVEAAHRSIFVAGWRPFIGWVCGVGLAWAFLGHPVAEWVVAITGADTTPPAIMTDNLMELVLAMLGMAGLRTFEKSVGKAK